MEVVCYSCDGYECVLIGYEGYFEVEGIMGQYDVSNGGVIYLVEDEVDVVVLEVCKFEVLYYVIQMILLMDDILKVIDVLCVKFLQIQGLCKNDICYVIQNCQDVVKELVDQCDMVLVVGSFNSFNFNCLCEFVEWMGMLVYLIDGVEDM